jgi:hypothetical protein
MLVKLYIADRDIFKSEKKIEIKEYECEREVIDVDEMGDKLYEYIYTDEKGIERRVLRHSYIEVDFDGDEIISEDRVGLVKDLEDRLEFDNMERWFCEDFSNDINDDDYRY